MHPRAIVGPPGTPSLNPHTGLPSLRRTVPGRAYARTRVANRPPNPACHEGGVVMPNPARRSTTKTLCVVNQGQGWSLVINVNGVPTTAYKATVSDQKQQYGQIWWLTKVSPRPGLLNGFNDWLPRCGTERLGTRLNPACHEGGVSVGACFPKFDPIARYHGGGSPAPNMVALQAQSQIPTVDPRNGMPRLRSRIWYR
jgi:hypothetical protein